MSRFPVTAAVNVAAIAVFAAILQPLYAFEQYITIKILISFNEICCAIEIKRQSEKKM